MRRLVLVVFLVALFLGGGVSHAFDLQGSTGFNFDWWDDDRDNSGIQLLIPLEIGGTYKDNLSLKLLTGYTYTEADPAGRESQSLSTILDTKLISSYAIVGELPVDLLVGLDINLPTGKTNFSQEELIVIMDPDLVTITSFGEGYNVNPTIMVAKGWERAVAGIGFGYAYRGEYDFSENIKDYDPGDILNASLHLRYYLSPSWDTLLYGTYAYYGEDESQNIAFYQEGPLLLIGLRFFHARPDWSTEFGIRSIFRDNSKIQDAAGNLGTEPQNSHGTEWKGDLSFRFPLDKNTNLSPYLEGLLITENSYPSNNPRFIGKRQKVTLGIGVIRSLTQTLTGELYLEGFLMHDDASQFPVPIPDRDFTGFSITGQLASTF